MQNKTIKYRHYGIKTHNLSHNKILICNNDILYNKLYNIFTIDILLNCDKFHSIEDHATRYIQKSKLRKINKDNNNFIHRIIKYFYNTTKSSPHHIPVTQNEKREVIDIIKLLIKDGFLISEKELISRVKAKLSNNKYCYKNNHIKYLGIPTHNRPLALEKCVNSYTKNINISEHNTKIIIAEDSYNNFDKDQDYIKYINNELGINISCIDRNDRKDISATIASKGNIPKHITDFAILGDTRVRINTGATRNTLLLLTSGQMSMQVDDDTICDVVYTHRSNDTLALSSQTPWDIYDVNLLPES